MNRILLVLALVAAVQGSIIRRNCTIDADSCKIVDDSLDEYEKSFSSGKFDVIYKQFAPNGFFKLMLHGQNGTAYETNSDYAGLYAKITATYPSLTQLRFGIDYVEKTDKITAVGAFQLYDVAKKHWIEGLYVQNYNSAGQVTHHVILAKWHDGKPL